MGANRNRRFFNVTGFALIIGKFWWGRIALFPPVPYVPTAFLLTAGKGELLGKREDLSFTESN